MTRNAWLMAALFAVGAFVAWSFPNSNGIVTSVLTIGAAYIARKHFKANDAMPGLMASASALYALPNITAIGLYQKLDLRFETNNSFALFNLLAFAAPSKWVRSKWFMGAYALVALLGNFRGGWLGLFAGLAVLAWFHRKWVMAHKWLVAVGCIAALGVFVWQNFFVKQGDHTTLTSTALSLITSRPLTGWGDGAFLSAMHSTYDHAHNLWLFVATEYGVPASLGVLALGLWVCWRLVQRGKVGELASLVSLGAASLGDVPTTSAPILFVAAYIAWAAFTKE